MRKAKLKLISFEMFMIIITCIFAYPMFMIINMSLKGDTELLLSPLTLPKIFEFSNYLVALKQMDYFNSLLNTTIITSLSVGFSTLIYCMAAYSIVRAKKHKKLFMAVYILFIAGMILPAQTTLIPLVWLFKVTRLIGTYHGITLLYTAGGAAFSLLLLTGFINTVPVSLEEAARIDGCTPYGTFFRIVLPLLQPVIVTLVIINAINIWNDFYTPLFFLPGKASKTIILSVYMFRGEYMTQWNVLFAGLVLATLPIMLVYCVLQKYIISGMALGAVKG